METTSMQGIERERYEGDQKRKKQRLGNAEMDIYYIIVCATPTPIYYAPTQGKIYPWVTGPYMDIVYRFTTQHDAYKILDFIRYWTNFYASLEESPSGVVDRDALHAVEITYHRTLEILGVKKKSDDLGGKQ